MDIPEKTLAAYNALTAENHHTDALIALCDAIIEYSQHDREDAMRQKKALEALNILHEYKGYLAPAFLQLRRDISKIVANLLEMAFTESETYKFTSSFKNS